MVPPVVWVGGRRADGILGLKEARELSNPNVKSFVEAETMRD